MIKQKSQNKPFHINPKSLTGKNNMESMTFIYLGVEAFHPAHTIDKNSPAPVMAFQVKLAFTGPAMIQPIRNTTKDKTTYPQETFKIRCIAILFI